MLLARAALTVAPASNQGMAVAILFGKNFHSSPEGPLAAPPPAIDFIHSATPDSDCKVSGNFHSTVEATMAIHVTKPAFMAIGIRHLGEYSRHTLRSI